MDEVNCMGQVVTDSLQEAIGACLSWDEALAMKLIEQRSELEDKFHSSMERLIYGVKADPEHVTDTLAVILLVKSLERILHHARNLAEVVIVRIRGETATDQHRIN
jgi:phosphate uptake regulator